MKLVIKKKRIIVILALLLVIESLTKAQPNISFYPFDDQFNSSAYNPAFLTSRERFTFSIFPMGGTSIGYNNQEAIGDLVSKFFSGISTDEDYKEVLKSMVDQSSFHQNIESTLLSFTYRSNVGFFNFRIRESESFSASAGGELTRFILKSDIRSAIINQIQELPAQAVHYREYSLGYSYKSRLNRFSAGIRAKLYLGKSSFYSGLSGSIQNESNSYVLRTSGLVNMSFPEEKELSTGGAPNFSDFNRSKVFSYLLNTGNPGFGVDLGIKYSITPDLTFSMSVIDLGKINWKSNLNSKYFDGKYMIPENSITPTSTDGGVQIITKNVDNFSYSDSISKLFDLTYDRSSFSRTMPLTIYAGIKYQLDPSLSISLTNRYLSLKDISYNSFSFTANYNINKKLSISSGYSVIGNSYINIPVAVMLRRDFGQIYLGTDNLVSLLVPSISDYAGISFGTCFYLFQKRDLNKSASDYLPFYKPRKIKKDKNNGRIIKAYPDS